MRKVAINSVDRISILPYEVREQILMCLPLRDAVKSSILSTKWRNLWTTLPTLVIDQTFSHEMVARPSKDYNMEVIAKLIMSDVCKVLMLHRGPLKDLSLSLSQFDHQILRFLPFQTMDSLTITDGGNCNISKTVFSSFSQLNKLCLSDCLLAFSSVSFEGFDRLTVLELRNVMFGADQPQLRFICPLLTTLILDRCDSYFERPCIVIEETPLLECFYLVGCFGHVRLRHCALLNEVVIYATDSTSLQLSGAFSKVESLSIGNICEFATSMKPLLKLRQLSLDKLRMNTRTRVLYVVRWIMNSLNLQRLAINLMEDTNGDDDDDDEALDMTELEDAASGHQHSRLLTKVQVKRIRGTKNEMSLISWLLISSPALDEMKIQLSSALSDADKLKVVIELNRLQRSSIIARVDIN